jgi:hypothetical protein
MVQCEGHGDRHEPGRNGSRLLLHGSGAENALALEPGEYHVYTSKKLPKPMYTGMNDETPGGKQTTARAIVFPNPTAGFLTIKSAIPYKSTELMDQTGNRLDAWNYKEKINLSEIREGLYLLRINYPDGFSETLKKAKY